MTSQQVGRNDLCPCGSGKKFKNCCVSRSAAHFEKKRGLPLFVILLIITALLALGATVFNSMRAPSPYKYTTPQTSQATANAGSGSKLVPPPAGPIPPGKVWSAEHGHWHDSPAYGTSSAGVAAPAVYSGSESNPVVQSQAPGPAPPGKIWSAEHGHWHDSPPGGATQSGSDSKDIDAPVANAAGSQEKTD